MIDDIPQLQRLQVRERQLKPSSANRISLHAMSSATVPQAPRAPRAKSELPADNIRLQEETAEAAESIANRSDYSTVLSIVLDRLATRSTLTRSSPRSSDPNVATLHPADMQALRSVNKHLRVLVDESVYGRREQSELRHAVRLARHGNPRTFATIRAEAIGTGALSAMSDLHALSWIAMLERNERDRAVVGISTIDRALREVPALREDIADAVIAAFRKSNALLPSEGFLRNVAPVQNTLSDKHAVNIADALTRGRGIATDSWEHAFASPNHAAHAVAEAPEPLQAAYLTQLHRGVEWNESVANVARAITLPPAQLAPARSAQTRALAERLALRDAAEQESLERGYSSNGSIDEYF